MASYKNIGEISATDVQQGFKVQETYLDKLGVGNNGDYQKGWQDYLIEQKGFNKDLSPKETWELRQSLEKSDAKELAHASYIPLKEALSISGYPVLLSSGIKQQLYQGYKLPQTIFQDLVTVVKTTKKQEQYGGLYETDLPELVLPGKPYPESALGEKRVFIEAQKFGRILALDMELVWHDQQNQILPKARSLGRGARIHQEKTVIEYIIDGSDANYRTTSSATGSALYSTANKNLLTTALSATSFEVAAAAFRSQTDDRGNPMLNMPDTFLGPLELEGAIHRILNAQGLTGVANQNQDGFNFAKTMYGGGFKILCSPFYGQTSTIASPTNDWHLLNRAMGMLIYQEVLPLTVLEEVSDSESMFSRDVKRFKVVDYWNIGCLDHRAVQANRV